MGKPSIYALIALFALGCGGGEGEDPGTPGEGAEDASAADSGRSGGDPWRDVESRARSSSDSSFLAGLGGLLFVAPIPTGNGRACATCHQPNKNFTLSPAEAEARFQANPNDPLFRSIDADDFANDYTTVRTKALFRVTIPLPSNIKLAANPAATSVQLFRAVPTVQNVKLTAPYTHDGRAVVLAEQARGAATEHSRPKKDLPSLAFDLIELFQERQFSSAAVKSISDTIDAGGTPPPVGQDYGGTPLTPLEQQGFAAFQEHCLVCHDGNGRSQINTAVFPGGFFTAFVSERNRANLPVIDFDVTDPATGVVTRVSSPDPGRMLISGNLADKNFFDATQLRGISKTAPYFHDNSSPTLQDALEHYNVLFTAFGIPTIRPEQFAPLLAYLNRL